MATRKYTATQLRTFRSEVAKLKRKGLVSKTVDSRKVKPTSHMVANVKKFRDVIDGKATVVTAKNKAQADLYSGSFKTKGSKIVIPTKDAVKPRFNKRTGEITHKGEAYGKTIRRRIVPHRLDSLDSLRKIRPKRGCVLAFAVPFGAGSNTYVKRWSDLDEMIKFMNGYEVKPKNPYTDWRKYVIVEDIPKDEAEELDGEDEEI